MARRRKAPAPANVRRAADDYAREWGAYWRGEERPNAELQGVAGRLEKIADALSASLPPRDERALLALVGAGAAAWRLNASVRSAEGDQSSSYLTPVGHHNTLGIALATLRAAGLMPTGGRGRGRQVYTQNDVLRWMHDAGDNADPVRLDVPVPRGRTRDHTAQLALDWFAHSVQARTWVWGNRAEIAHESSAELTGEPYWLGFAVQSLPDLFMPEWGGGIDAYARSVLDSILETPSGVELERAGTSETLRVAADVCAERGYTPHPANLYAVAMEVRGVGAP